MYTRLYIKEILQIHQVNLKPHPHKTSNAHLHVWIERVHTECISPDLDH